MKILYSIRIAVLATMLTASASLRAEDATLESVLPDPEERAAVEKVLAYHGVEPEINAGGRQPTVALYNEADRNSIRFVIDGESQRITSIRSNRSGLHNEHFVWFQPLDELEALFMDHTFDNKRTEEIEFDGSGLDALAGLEKLTFLRFPGGAFADAGAEAVARMPRVEELIVFHTEISNAGLGALSEHPSLRMIQLGPAWRPELVTPEGFAHLAAMPALEEINLAEIRLYWEDGLEHLAAAKDRIRKIDLKNCAVLPEDLAKLRAAMPDTEIEYIGFEEFIRQYDDGSLKFGGKLKREVDPAYIEKIRAAAEGTAPAEPEVTLEPEPAEERTWTNPEGETFEGVYVSSEDETVTILRAVDQREFEVPLSELSEGDREYVAGRE